ncbi:MAG: hypothetical protein KY455_14035, partial [Euryarchaeota archaeon]|nr:hypothetical protein [Euryarchaeota archaeon]
MTPMRVPAAARAVLLVVILALVLLPVPDLSAQEGAGPRDTLRLYGCSDALRSGSEARPVVAAPVESTSGTSLDSDGRPDCDGDLLRLPGAWQPGSGSAFLRQALGPRDQSVHLSLRHLPTAWFPGPGHGPDAVADPTDPRLGLFDRGEKGPDGRLSLRLVSDEEVGPGLDPDQTRQAVDLENERDFLPDHRERHLDGAALDDLYFPALEAQYHWRWSDATGAPAGVPDGGGLVFPFADALESPRGLDGWELAGEETPVAWRARPFGLGTAGDGAGALVVGPVEVTEGRSVRFLDHSVRVSGFFGPADRAQVVVEVLYHGGSGPEVLDQGVVMAGQVEPPRRQATMTEPGEEPSNVLFADRLGTRRTVPDPFDMGAVDDDDDDAWFVLVEDVEREEGEPATATLRVGRLIAPRAPLNAFASDGALYRVTDLEEREGALRDLGLAQLLPLGDGVFFSSPGIPVAGLAETEMLPLLPPFRRPHLSLPLVGRFAEHDPWGFLDGSQDLAGTTSLSLTPAGRAPAERSERSPPLEVSWVHRGVESRLAVAAVVGASDADLLVSMRTPSRFVELLLPDGDFLLYSALLDDRSTLSGATAAGDSPRGFRTLRFSDGTASRMFADGRLRLMGSTQAVPGAGDVVVPDPALLLSSDHLGRVRAPDALAHERVAVWMSYSPYHRYEEAGRGLVPRFDESVAPDADPDTRLDVVDLASPQDHLFDVVGDNQEPARGDVYGPAINVGTRYSFLSRVGMEPLHPPLGGDTRLLLPASDLDPRVPGLDSFDMDGDGTPDDVRLQGFWDMDGPTDGRFRTGGVDIVTQGSAATEDFLWLRSPPLRVVPEQTVRFFDHGMRFAGSGTEGATFTAYDLSPAGAPRPMGNVSGLRVGAEDCIAINFDRTMDFAAIPCDQVVVSPSTPNSDPRDKNDMWWMELTGTSNREATVVLNRVVTDVDRGAVGDQTGMHVGGVAYRFTDVAFARGEKLDRFASLVIEQVVPLGRDVAVRDGDAEHTLTAVPVRGKVPFLPPFNGPHKVLQANGVALERDRYGFLDSRTDPDDADAVRLRPEDRIRESGAMVVSVEAWRRPQSSAFLFLDPLRLLDPQRTGPPLFLNGVHADPLDGLRPRPSSPLHVPVRLATTGPDGFGEALRSGGDRGWDHYAALRLPPTRGLYLVDSARLAHPGLAATLEDRGPGDAGNADGVVRPGDTRHPNAPMSGPWAPSRGSGLWLFDAADARDLYVGTWSPPREEPPV